MVSVVVSSLRGQNGSLLQIPHISQYADACLSTLDLGLDALKCLVVAIQRLGQYEESCLQQENTHAGLMESQCVVTALSAICTDVEPSQIQEVINSCSTVAPSPGSLSATSQSAGSTNTGPPHQPPAPSSPPAPDLALDSAALTFHSRDPPINNHSKPSSLTLSSTATAPSTATVHKTQSRNSSGSTNTFSTTQNISIPVTERGNSPSAVSTPKPPHHSAHPPIAAIAAVISVLVLALLAALYLYVRRLKRRRANHANSTSQKGDEGSGFPRALSSAQHILDDATERPSEALQEGAPSWAASTSVLTSAPRQDVLSPGLDRAASSIEHRPLLRQSTASSLLAPTAHSYSSSTTSSGVENGGARHGRPSPCVVHGQPSWGRRVGRSARFVGNGWGLGRS
ncbi:hypothetical protein C8Q70DRAFT_596214 [Cubamyces menziesii]|nr:hypothetical protein C8Q70DRAFT_596214 [Cubamyces menziesii]